MKGSPAALLVVLLLASCTAHAPHRLNARGEAVEARIHPGDLATAEGRRRAESSALEVHDDFQLLFLEFDDQGSHSTSGGTERWPILTQRRRRAR